MRASLAIAVACVSSVLALPLAGDVTDTVSLKPNRADVDVLPPHRPAFIDVNSDLHHGDLERLSASVDVGHKHVATANRPLSGDLSGVKINGLDASTGRGASVRPAHNDDHRPATVMTHTGHISNRPASDVTEYLNVDGVKVHDVVDVSSNRPAGNGQPHRAHGAAPVHRPVSSHNSGAAIIHDDVKIDGANLSAVKFDGSRTSDPTVLRTGPHANGGALNVAGLKLDGLLMDTHGSPLRLTGTNALAVKPAQSQSETEITKLNVNPEGHLVEAESRGAENSILHLI